MDRWACFLNCIHFEPQHLSQHGQEVLKVLRTKGHDNWAKCIYKQRSCDMTESSRTPTIWTLWKRLFSRSGMCFTHSASCKLQRISSTFIAVKTYLNVKKRHIVPNNGLSITSQLSHLCELIFEYHCERNGNNCCQYGRKHIKNSKTQ